MAGHLFIDTKAMKARGFLEINAALGRMEKYLRKGFVRDLRLVGQEVRRDYRGTLREFFTRRTGRLFGSIGYAVNPSNGTLVVGPRRSGFYAYFLAFGTKTKEGTPRIKPRLFIDPVAERGEKTAQETLGAGWHAEWTRS